jgi:hypothetical protein
MFVTYHEVLIAPYTQTHTHTRTSFSFSVVRELAYVGIRVLSHPFTLSSCYFCSAAALRNQHTQLRLRHIVSPFLFLPSPVVHEVLIHFITHVCVKGGRISGKERGGGKETFCLEISRRLGCACQRKSEKTEGNSNNCSSTSDGDHHPAQSLPSPQRRQGRGEGITDTGGGGHPI